MAEYAQRRRYYAVAGPGLALLPPVGMGQIDALGGAVGKLADQIVEALLPSIKPLAVEAMVAAKPTIREIVKEDVLPWVIVGMVGAAAASALIGAWMARR